MMDQSKDEVMKQWYFVPGVYIVLCTVYLSFGLHANNQLLKLVLKCAPIAFLIYMTISFLIGYELGPLGFDSTITNLERLLWGLVFSVLGDFYLVFDSLFLLGVGSFAIAQAIYIYLFHGPMLLFYPLDQKAIITGIAIALVSAVIYFYILPKLSRVLAVALLLYCVLISTMLWSAIVGAQQVPDTSNMKAAVGACLFYSSDLLLGLKTWRLKIPIADFLVMVTYYAAQLLIAQSVFVV